MKPKSSCCQFYPIRLCGKRRTEERPKRGKAFFFWNQKEIKGRRETTRRRRQGIETPKRRGRKDDRYCWGQIEAPRRERDWSGYFEISGEVVGGVQRTNGTMHGAGGEGRRLLYRDDGAGRIGRKQVGHGA